MTQASGWRWIFTVAACAVALVTGPARAQDLSFGEARGGDDLLADQLVLLALASVEGRGEPRPDQLERAMFWFEQALALTPQDPELWRLRAELASASGDDAGRLAAIRRYVELVPEDDVAQLELIHANLAEIQTLDERLAMLERLYAVEALGKPLRSRLASSAARAAIEMNRDEDLARWLTRAVRLDPANVEAAQMLYRLARDRHSPPAQIGVTLIGWVAAAPSSVAARIELGTLLMGQAVYDRAAEQFEIAWKLEPGQLDEASVQMWVGAVAAAQRTPTAVGLLDQYEMMVRHRLMQAEAQELMDRGQDPRTADLESATRPVLPPELELLRLALAKRTQEGRPDTSLANLRRMLDEMIEAGDETARLDLLWIDAMFGREGELTDVTARIGAEDADHPLVRRAAGWVALRRGERDEAREHFEALSDDDPFAAYGLALLHEDGSSEQTEAFVRLIHRHPSRMPGILAAVRLREAGLVVPATQLGGSLRREMDRQPYRIWSTDLSRSPWFSIKIEVDRPRVGFLDPVWATLSIRNTSGTPLAIGSPGTVSTQAMVTFRASITGTSLGQVPPVFVDLNRRLTVPTNDRLSTRVRLDRSALGRLLANYPAHSITVGASARLDPKLTARGGATIGPLGSVDSISALTIAGQLPTPENLELWLADFERGGEVDRMRALPRLLYTVGVLGEEGEARQMRARAVDTINGEFTRMSVRQQAWTVRFLSLAREQKQLFQRIIDQAQRSDEPLVRLMYLVTQVEEADSPQLAAAIRHDNPQIKGFAQAYREGLRVRAEMIAEAERAQQEAASGESR